MTCICYFQAEIARIEEGKNKEVEQIRKEAKATADEKVRCVALSHFWIDWSDSAGVNFRR